MSYNKGTVSRNGVVLGGVDCFDPQDDIGTMEGIEEFILGFLTSVYRMNELNKF